MVATRRRLPRPALGGGLAALAALAAACSGGGPAAVPAPGHTATTTVVATTTTTGVATAPGAGAGTSATASVTVAVPDGNGGGAFSTPRALTVPVGWTAEVWARVPGARMEAWTPEGDLLVSVPGAGQVVELTPGPDRSAVPTRRVILTGLTQPQGLAFAEVGGQETLYVGESDEIDRYPWRAGTPGARTVVAGSLPDLDPSGDDVHRPKDVAVGTDGTVYFEVGSSSNANPDDVTASPPRGVIMSVQPDGSGLHVVATGVRNGEGLSIAPDGTLWTAVNERDNVTFPFHQAYGGMSDAFGKVVTAYVDEHPPDEVAAVTPGRDLGWPYCNPDQDESTPAGSMSHIPLVADALTNPGGTVVNCATLAAVNVGLPAHSAPLGFHFLEGSALAAPWSGGAVVAVHGSWDREPPRPPAVLWLAWNAAAATLDPSVTLVGGFQEADGSRWGRPADAVAGPDGALYVSDDTAGAVYRLVPPASSS
jgi:glucose/arabinose dehydrogenase